MREVWIAAYILFHTCYRHSVHAVNPFTASFLSAGERSKNSVVSLTADEFGFPYPQCRYHTQWEEKADLHPGFQAAYLGLQDRLFVLLLSRLTILLEPDIDMVGYAKGLGHFGSPRSVTYFTA